MIYKFFDTTSLLLAHNNLFSEDYKLVISSITLEELENIKTSANKDAEIKYRAREVVRQLTQNPNKYDLVIFKDYMLDPILAKAEFNINNDLKILASAFDYDYYKHPDETVFVTNDLTLKLIANLFFGEDSVESIEIKDEEQYSGYKEIQMADDNSLAFLYENLNTNHFDLLPNQYLIIKDCGGSIVDQLCWTGETHRQVQFQEFFSRQFGKIRPYKGDIQQLIAADSLAHNQITMIKGPAGSGKTLLSLGYLFSQLEKGKIDKIIVFCNTVATKDSAKLGYLPGDRNDKLLDSQIGNLLSSKLGGRIEVERLVQEETLLLLPLSDVRGFDTSGMRAGIYISEAQNMTIALMKLALQRIGEDSICIIDGDDQTQVDCIEFSGANNGMKRASKIFRGEKIYGEVELKNIHRSKIARLAEKM